MAKLRSYNLTDEGGITSQDPSEMAPEWFTDDQDRWVDVMASETGDTEHPLGPLDLHERVQAAWASPERRPEVIVMDKLLFFRLPYLGLSGEIHTLHMLCGPTAIVSARTAPLDEIDQLATALETGARIIRPTVADLLIEIAAVMMHAEAWLTELLGKHRYGKAIILGCFCFLLAGHVAEAAAWGLFLRWQRLVLTVSEGLYFAAVTITTLGYGALILAHFFGCGHRFLHGDDVAILRESRGSICGEAVKASITAGFCKSLKATTLRTMRGGMVQERLPPP